MGKPYPWNPWNHNNAQSMLPTRVRPILCTWCVCQARPAERWWRDLLDKYYEYHTGYVFRTWSNHLHDNISNTRSCYQEWQLKERQQTREHKPCADHVKSSKIATRLNAISEHVHMSTHRPCSAGAPVPRPALSLPLTLWPSDSLSPCMLYVSCFIVYVLRIHKTIINATLISNTC